MNDEQMLGVGIGGVIVLLLLSYYIFALVVRLLAQRNIFVTLVEEATAKAFLYNGRFQFLIMSYRGRAFVGDLNPNVPLEEDKWEVVESEVEQSRRTLPLLRNIHWIGLPPFAEPHTYKFAWASLEDRQSEGGGLEKKVYWKEEIIDYILLQQDVYVTKLMGLECSDKIPLDTTIILGGRVINPYKALFRVERWLEATQDVAGAKMRDFFGTRTYEQLLRLAKPEAGDMPGELRDFFQTTFDWIEEHYGFEPTFLRIYSVDPGSELAADFIRATTQVYVAEQGALAAEHEGRGLAARDTAHFGAIAAIPGASDMFKWQRIGESGLTTYVEGGGAIVSVPASGTQNPNRQNAPNNRGGGTPSPATPPTTPIGP